MSYAKNEKYQFNNDNDSNSDDNDNNIYDDNISKIKISKRCTVPLSKILFLTLIEEEFELV